MKKQITKQLKTVAWQGMAALYLLTYGMTAYSQAFDWVKRVGGNHTENSFRAVATDNSGNVVIAGHMQSDTIDLNNGNSNGMIPLPGGNQTDNSGIGGFVAKYDAGGNFLWGNLTDKARTGAVATDADGNIFITGWFQTPSIDFNPGGSGGELYNTGGSSANVAFVVKYNAAGDFQWAKGITSFAAQGVGGGKGTHL